MAKNIAYLQSGARRREESDLQKNLVVPAHFKDHFSTQSGDYARFRPSYPATLFDFLSSVTSQHTFAWDAATGNGQAAVALTNYFRGVVASDASEAQIASAIPHPKVEYRVARAEDSGLDDNTIDLVTVGQAFHWFEQDAFLREAARVLHSDGVLALWCYEICHVNEQCDAVIDRLYSDIVGGYWPAERVFIEQGYDSVTLPGEQLVTPDLAMSLQWTAQDMLGYVSTWSACKRYQADKGKDPVEIISEALVRSWGEAARTVSWPLKLKVSRINSLLE